MVYTLNYSEDFSVKNYLKAGVAFIFLALSSYIGKSSFSYPFTLSTGSLEQGSHSLKVKVTNSAARKQTSQDQVFFYVDNLPLIIQYDMTTGFFSWKRSKLPISDLKTK